MRAIQNAIDPYLQVSDRLMQLERGGHSTDKVELIVQGGTFPALDRSYQEWFVKSCLDAIHGEESRDLGDCFQIAERSGRRCVGLTVETRPDYCKEADVDLMLRLGVTRVEVGVQSLFEEVLLRTNRGHGVEDVVDCFRIAKDCGLKVVAHMMPGLPGANPGCDIEGFKLLFGEERYRPDMVKIYPTLVVKGTGLYDAWLRGDYAPLDSDTASRLVADIKEVIPSWARVMRVQRDIPSDLIVSGVKRSNLRELAWGVLRERGRRCRCIRCREVGLQSSAASEYDPVLTKASYKASRGEEIFLSFEDSSRDVLFAYLRLRSPSSSAHRPEIGNGRTCIVRELRSLGRSLSLGSRGDASWQHKGLGRSLMAEAEEIAKTEYDAKKLAVIAAVGTRPYYRRLGYSLDGPYMSKDLGP